MRRRGRLTMDEVERVIRVFQAHGYEASVASKLDALMELEHFREPRVLDFMLQLLADRQQPRDVRMYVLKRTRNGRLAANERPAVARVVLDLVEDRSHPEMRVQAALALGEFTDVSGVVAGLCGVASDLEESLELRYAAFTALDRAGPTPEYLALLHQLRGDEMLGHSARSALAAWDQRTEHDPKDPL